MVPRTTETTTTTTRTTSLPARRSPNPRLSSACSTPSVRARRSSASTRRCASACLGHRRRRLVAMTGPEVEVGAQPVAMPLTRPRLTVSRPRVRANGAGAAAGSEATATTAAIIIILILIMVASEGTMVDPASNPGTGAILQEARNSCSTRIPLASRARRQRGPTPAGATITATAIVIAAVAAAVVAGASGRHRTSRATEQVEVEAEDREGSRCAHRGVPIAADVGGSVGAVGSGRPRLRLRLSLRDCGAGWMFWWAWMTCFNG